VEGFKELRLRTKVELERSELPGRFRLIVTSPDFDKLLESERQDLIWRVLRERWSRDDQLRLTLTFGLSEKEAQGIF
jgi:hypothetical protein